MAATHRERLQGEGSIPGKSAGNVAVHSLHRLQIRLETRPVDRREDGSEKSTLAAIAYLKELHQMFGDWTTVLAAYNCGEWAVLNRIRTQRINYLDNFWDLYERLPRETSFYVPRFLAVLQILEHPETYGFTLPSVEKPLETVEVPVSKQVHLKNVAERLDIDYELLKEMNPELRYNSTPKSAYDS